MPDIIYKRVSTLDQNTDRQQFEGITAAKVFEDKASGKDTKRPQLEACIDYAREGDTVHVYSIDRLARNLADLQRLVEAFNQKGVTVAFKKEGLTFSANNDNAMNKLLFQIMGAFAEFERNMIRERQTEGIAKAKERGAYNKNGRKPSLNQTQIEEIKQLAASKQTPISKIAKQFGVTRPTVYKVIQ